MRSEYDIETIANILLDKDVEKEGLMLSTMQRGYLESFIEELDIANKNALKKNNYESREGLNALAKLQANPKLMVILGLSDFSATDLIEILACYVSEDFEAKIIKNEEGFCLQLDRKPTIEVRAVSKPPTVDEFLAAKVHHGPLREVSCFLVDGRGEKVEPIYDRLLETKHERFYHARYLDLYANQERKISCHEGGVTNLDLLEFFITNEESIREPFIAEDFERIEGYFTYWLGETFRFYADLDSN